MRALAIGAMVAFLGGGPGQDENRSIGTELEELAAKVNGHASFRLVYQGSLERDGHAHAATLEIAYEAPDRAMMRMQEEDVRLEVVLERFDYFLRDGDTVWRRARIPESAALALFEELLPAAASIGPGVMLNVKARSGFWLPMAWSEFGRRSFFGCYSQMMHQPDDVERADGSLAWTDGVLTIRLSRETGFPAEIEILDEDARLRLVLAEAELEATLEDLIEVPDDVREAQVDTDIQSVFDRQYAHWNARHFAFTRLAYQLREGMRDLDEETRERFQTFLEFFHRQAIERKWGGWLADLRENTGAFMAWARETRAVDRAVIEPRAYERRQLLESGFEEALENYAARLAGLTDDQLPDELFELELGIVERLHAELVSGPILAYFDEQVEAVLGD
jgi:hypothetical protein